MIAYIDGTLTDKDPTKVIVEVNGIGYELNIPLSTYDAIPSVGEKLTLNTYLHVRQDILQLFGFHTREEKILFLLLISSVAGVGPKLALNILSAFPVATFCNAIVNQEVKTLSRINGIGKRSAERLIIELKDKVQDILLATTDSTEATSEHSSETIKAVEDAVNALITLGFKSEKARRTISSFVKENQHDYHTPETLIRNALMILNR